MRIDVLEHGQRLPPRITLTLFRWVTRGKPDEAPGLRCTGPSSSAGRGSPNPRHPPRSLALVAGLARVDGSGNYRMEFDRACEWTLMGAGEQVGALIGTSKQIEGSRLGDPSRVGEELGSLEP